jgi:hypothetical protein
VQTAIVERIIKGNPTRVQCVVEKDIDFDDGEHIVFSEVKVWHNSMIIGRVSLQCCETEG